MDTAEKKNAKFTIDSKGICARAAMALLALSALFRVIGCWEDMGDKIFTLTEIVLPISCCLLFIVCILLFGKKGFFLSSIPLILGVVFFIIKSFRFDSVLHTILCILLYLVVALIYTATVFGVIRTKWLLIPLFALPFLYHVCYEDVLKLKAGEFTLFTGLQEISVLCIMLALFFTAIGLKKVKPAIEADLPKIKDPVVIPPDAKDANGNDAYKADVKAQAPSGTTQPSPAKPENAGVGGAEVKK